VFDQLPCDLPSWSSPLPTRLQPGWMPCGTNLCWVDGAVPTQDQVMEGMSTDPTPYVQRRTGHERCSPNGWVPLGSWPRWLPHGIHLRRCWRVPNPTNAGIWVCWHAHDLCLMEQSTNLTYHSTVWHLKQVKPGFTNHQPRGFTNLQINFFYYLKSIVFLNVTYFKFAFFQIL